MKRVYVLSLTMVICLVFTGMAFAQTKDDVTLHKA
jgi:hypothetical protein